MELRAPPSSAPAASSRRPVNVWAACLACACLGGVAGFWARPRLLSWRSAGAALQHTRLLASKLKAAGAPGEAAALYERYLQSSEIAERAAVAYTVGQLYLEEGQYEKALRWLYEADSDEAGELHGDIGKKIVHALEGMGRLHAARAALAEQTELTTQGQRSDDPVVAMLGKDPIHRSEVLRALDDLPPELRKSMGAAAAREQFLRRYVADELLWRKAQRLELDRDPAVRRHVELALRQAAIGAFIEKEVLNKIAVSPADLQNFFSANRSRYNADMAAVQGQVERDYRAMKMQAAYQELITRELAAAEVQLFAERLGTSP